MSHAASALPKLGVLGGMGPLATVDFMHKVIDATPAHRDQEHIPVIVHSVPQIPDRSTAFLSGSDAPWDYLLAGLRVLETAGADVIAIPCNTAHLWHGRLAALAHVPVLHIGKAACNAIDRRIDHVRRVGLLATSATLKARIYHNELERAGIEAVMPCASSQETLVMAGINAVKAGQLEQGRMLLRGAAEALADRQVDALLLACTEIPVALAGLTFGAPVLDATDMLARECVAWWQRALAYSPSITHTHE
ncbi:aspartate/glutamate racemase family protein [Paraburkholderia fynbosensis]|uniref:Aspartate racemase n=1 Tax=Paraburkholderia fynbosensis TaxID=1200993 RepID=A0A6J5H4E9_9BURK|nr:amino acid racemase [Paraburkholderia fynbosensis]CAB3810792.1 Aspartate racemase [Paraburkholderia fynbosensis]